MKKVFISTLHILCFSFLLSTVVSAQVGTWTGGGGNNLWSNPSNWAGNTVPSTNHDVTIPFNSGNIEFDITNRTIRNLFVSGKNRLTIQPGKRLNVNNSPYANAILISGDGVIINEGSLILDNGQNGIEVNGAFQNEGEFVLYNFTDNGIINLGKFLNYGYISLNTVGGGNNFAIDARSGLLGNYGEIKFPYKYPSNGFSVNSGAEVYNDRNGDIIFENGNNGLFLINGLVNNHGIIRMNQTSNFNHFIRLNGDMVNHKNSGLLIDFNAAGNNVGVYLDQGGTLTNKGTIEMDGTSSSQIGVEIVSSSVFEITEDGSFKTTRVGTGVYVNEYVARFENAGFCKFRYYVGLRNRFGNVENSGTMRFDNGADLLNSRNLTNEACGSMIFYGDINNQQGTFTNDGALYASTAVMTNRDFFGNAVQNHGVVHDPYDFFEGNVTSQGYRVGPLEMVPGQVVYTPALEGGTAGSIGISSEWYRNSNLTVPLGYYNFINGNLAVYFPAAEGKSHMWIQFTFPSGCSKKMWVRFDAPLEGPDQETNPHDFALHRQASDQETPAAKLTVFPNPSNGQVNLQFDQMLSGTTELRLTDLTGRTVWTQKEQDLSNLSLDLTGLLPTGVYHLQVLHADALLTTQRLVIQAN